MTDKKSSGYPLHDATANGHVHEISALLEAGADIDPRRKDGATPLFLATLDGHTVEAMNQVAVAMVGQNITYKTLIR